MGKILNAKQSMDIPDGVECSVKARVVTIKGPRGTLVRSFRHLAIDIYMEGPTKLTVEKHFGKRKENAAIRTVCSIINNAIVGVVKAKKKRFCLLRKVGFKNKKGFVSGDRFCGLSGT